MGSLHLSLPSHRSLARLAKAPAGECYRCNFRGRTSVIHCVDAGSGGGNVVRSSGVPFVLTGRSAWDSDIVPYNGSTSTSMEMQDGIGIIRFLRGKVFFITGATGFLAKVLIEKILRTVPDVGKIYVLIKAKNKEAAMARMKLEIINADLFGCLRKAYGKSFEAFMFSKLVPLVGNVCESDLGLEEGLADLIADEIDVIVNSAANTTFDERYDVAIDVNTRGPNHLMAFSKKCNNLKVFSQVSTGDSIESESFPINGSAKRCTLELDIKHEMELAAESLLVSEENEVDEKMRALGQQRARKYGWQDTYVFTKAMGEMMIDNLRGNAPVVIIRPSVIESTCKEPFPGWMEGNRMMDPMILYYEKGQLTGFLADPNGVLDVVPADIVVNATLAAIVKNGMDQKPDINIYHIVSSAVNPLFFEHLTELMYEHYKSSPYTDSKGSPINVPSIQLFSSMYDFSQHLLRDAIRRTELTRMASSDGKLSQRHEFISRKYVEQAMHLTNIYLPYTFYDGRFDNSNTQRLMESMSENEKRKFGFDVGSIDWRDYITNVHIQGLRKHVMKGRGMTGN